jgi:hypothetical protein
MTAAVPRPSNRIYRRLACTAVAATAVALAFQAGRRTRPGQPPAPEPPPAVVTDEPPAPRRRPWRRVLLAVSVLVVTGGTVAVVADELDGFACLSSPEIAPDTAPTDVPGMRRVPRLESLPSRGPRIKVGEVAEVRDPSTYEVTREVSVWGTNDVAPGTNLQPSAGRRLVSVKVREHNISDRGGYVLTVNHRVWLCDEDGTWYEHDAKLTKALTGEAMGIDEGMQLDHRVVFQIYEHSQPHLVRVAHVSGWTASGDWKVG